MNRHLKSTILTIQLISGLIFVADLHANQLSPADFSRFDKQIESEELFFLNAGLKPEAAGLFFIDSYMPWNPQKVTLRDEWGENYGYPFYQRLGIHVFEKPEQKAILWGAGYQYRRQGWSQKDFLWVMDKSGLNTESSFHLGGIWMKDREQTWKLGAGVSRLLMPNSAQVGFKNKDPWGFWASGEFGVIHAIGSQNYINVGLELEDRQVRGGQMSGLKTYLPRIDYEWKMNQNFIVYEQNLFKQHVYSVYSQNLDELENWTAILHYYIDRSRFFDAEISYQNTRSTKERMDFQPWGAALKLGLLRLSYNDALMNQRLGVSEVLCLTWSISLSSLRQEFWYAPGAAQANPFELSNDSKEKIK